MSQDIKYKLMTMCMVQDKDKVLLINRPDRLGYPGYIAPGGKVEFPESIVDSAIREVKEETGLLVKDIIYKGLDEFCDPNDGLRYMVFNYLATSFEGELLENPPEGELLWININEALGLTMQDWFKRRFPLFFNPGTFELSVVWDSKGKKNVKETIREYPEGESINDLATFTRVLDDLGIEYALGGSGLMYSLKLIDKVNDWDITTDCTQGEIIRALKNFEWKQAPSGDYPFASNYRIHIPKLNIDIIGKFALHTNEGICELPSVVSSRWNGIKIASTEVWFVAYSLMGRDSKARLLYNYLESNGADASVLNKLLSNDFLSKEISNKLHKLLIDNLNR